MKKILLIFLLAGVSVLSFLLFNDKGNEYLKPYLTTYLESQFKQNSKIEIQHLKIDYEQIEFTATLNKRTTLNAHGDYSLSNRTIDIDYTLHSDGFKSEKLSFTDTIELQGDAKGDLDELKIRGEGVAFNSKVDYHFNFRENLIQNIKINIKEAEIEQLLLLAKKPSYAKGKADIELIIPSLKKQPMVATAHLVLHQTTLNRTVFEKEFQINLPKNTQLTGTIDAKIKKEVLDVRANLDSNYSKIKITKATYHLKREELSAHYLLSIPKLSKLIFSTQKQLFGAFKAEGFLQLKKRHLSLELFSKSFGGEANFLLDNNRLTAHLSHLEAVKIFYLLGKEPYLKGEFSSDITLTNLKDLEGNFTLTSYQLQTIHPNFKKKFNLDFGKSIALQLNTKGEIKSNVLNLKTTIDSKLFHLQSSDMEYHLKASTLLATYMLHLPKLSKLNSVTKRKLQGELDIHGKILLDKELKITGETNNLEGAVAFELTGDNLHSTIEKVSVKKLMHLLDYPQIFNASLVGKFDYNLATHQGSFTSTLNKAQLLANNLTNLVKQIRGIDLTKERYTKTDFNARLHKELINFNFNAKSRTVHLAIKNGKIDKLANTIDAKYKLNIQNRDIRGEIKGDVSKPNVTVDGSQFIQEALINTVKEKIGIESLEDLGIGKKETDAIKTIFRDLFR